MTVRKMSKEEHEANIIKENLEKGNSMIKTAKDLETEPDVAGMRRVFDYISLSRIPVITHNGFLDILHTYDKFYYRLPERHQDFKSAFSNYFPSLFDTKFMLNNSNILYNQVGAQTDLSGAFKNLFKYHPEPPIIELNTQFREYQLSGENDALYCHEAGYDALITGYVFFKALQLLSKYFKCFFTFNIVFFRDFPTLDRV